MDTSQVLMNQYEDFKEKVRNGELGKTARFWLLYLDLMRMQHLAHTAVQENNFDMKVLAWQNMIPFYFYFNKLNYARYGTFYLQQLTHINILYPGLKSLLIMKGLSVQAQTVHPVRTAIDQRGEQPINKDPKTSGGVKSFASDSPSVLKWCLNRAEQAKNVKALNEMSGTTTGSVLYKALRPSQILASERMVAKVIEVPPCYSVFKLHATRALYVAKVWRSTATAWLDLQDITRFGWEADGTPIWIEEAFPDDITELILMSNEEEIEESDGDEEEEESDQENEEEDGKNEEDDQDDVFF